MENNKQHHDNFLAMIFIRELQTKTKSQAVARIADHTA